LSDDWEVLFFAKPFPCGNTFVAVITTKEKWREIQKKETFELFGSKLIVFENVLEQEFQTTIYETNHGHYHHQNGGGFVETDKDHRKPEVSWCPQGIKNEACYYCKGHQIPWENIYINK
jgi:hypothetical protein